MLFLSKKTIPILLGIVLISAFALLAHAQDSSTAQTTDGSDSSSLTNADGTDSTDAAAQLAASGAPTADDINAELDPTDPASFTPVTISLTSDLVDLSRADVEWTVNGKAQPGGIGARTLSVTTGNYGTTTTVTVVVTDTDGDVINKTISLEPNDLAVVWEATDSYVPPFYEGKKLPSRGAIVRVAAIPNFSDFVASGDVSNYVYTWTRNGDVVPAASGYGKDSFDFVQNPIDSSEDIEVTASDVGNTETATRDADVSFFNPNILFYGKNIVTGLESPIAASPLEITASSVAVDAEPYYFSARTGPEILNFSWTVDGTPVSLDPGSPKHLIILKSSATSQSSNIDLSVNNPNTPFQSAEGTLHVDFQPAQ
jgi:hypothetical protein